MVPEIRDIKPLIEKLSHPLEGVRVPALKSLLSKLELSILTVEDLCQEKLLFIRLLEWFNFDEVTNEELVFSLLKKLVGHRTSASILLKIGAVDFFSQLRPNVNELFLPDIDSLIHKLLTIPEAINDDEKTVDYSKRLVEISEFESNTEPFKSQSHQIHNEQSLASRREDSYNNSKQHMCRTFKAIEETFIDIEFLNFLYFPWRPLTHSDKTVLESAKNSLRGATANVVVLSCKFINDVLFSDFPAEIFLQYPNIVEELFELIKVRQRKNWDLHLEPINALLTLSENLLRRLSFLIDPDYHTPSLLNHGHSMGVSFANKVSSSVVEDLSRSMSHVKFDSPKVDTSFCSQSTIEGPFKGYNRPTDEDEAEEIIAEDIKTSQYSLPQFCAVVLSSIQHLFKAPNSEVVFKAAQLSVVITELIKKSVNVKAMWETKSALGAIFRKDIEVFSHALASAIKHNSEITKSMRSQFRYNVKEIESQVAITNLETMLLASFSNEVVEDLNLIQSPGHLQEIKGAVQEMIYNYELKKFYPTAVEKLTKSCITENSPESHRLELDRQIHESILNLAKALEQEPKDENAFLVEFIRQSHLALGFSQSNFELIDRSINIASDFCDYDDDFYKKVLQTLVEYLSSPYDTVRIHAYRSCQKFVEKCLEIDANANKMTNQPSKMLKFLLSEEILTVLIQSGLLDQNDQVKECASWILYQFLNSQLLFESDTWSFFISNVMHYFVFLQSLTSKDSKFGNTLLNMVAEGNSDSVTTVLNIPTVDKLRGCLRLMFNTDLKVRIEAVGMLVWHLAKESQGHLRLPSFSNTTMPRLHNLLFPENQLTVDRESTERLNTKTNTLDSVLDIAQSKKLDEGVRKSAFDQVAILLQDPAIHEHFLERKGIEYVVKFLNAALEKANEKTIEHQYLPSVVSILRNLFFWHSKTRHRYSHDSHMLFSLVRSAFVLNENVGAVSDVLFALSLLLFDEVLQPGNEEVFSVPRIIRLHFKLPFSVEARDNELSSKSRSILPDPMENPLSVAFLKSAFSDIVEPLIALEENPHPENSLYDVQLNVARALNSIIGAQNHLEVSENLQILKYYLTIAKSEPKFYADYLKELDFSVALEKFLSVIPSSNEDRKLLSDIAEFINYLLKDVDSFPEVFSWIDGVLCSKESLFFLALNDQNLYHDTDLTDSLLRCIQSFALQKSAVLKLVSASEIIPAVIERVKVCDNAETYDLSSLHKCLRVLSYVTETQNWSVKMKESQISQIFPTLVAIVSSFSTGRVSSNLSFMGCAVIEMILHILSNLARELAVMFRQNFVWVDHWKISVNEHPFNWLTSRLSHRNPHTRLLCYNLVAQFCVSKQGQKHMINAFDHFAGGLWTILFEVATDKSECCSVKAQCLMSLIQLTKELEFPSLHECEGNSYVGPLVVDNLSNVPISGLRALELLVVSFDFFPIFAQALMQFFPFSSLKLAQKVSGSNSLEKFNLECCRISLQHSEFAIEASEALATPKYIAAMCNFALNILQLLPEIALKSFKALTLYQSLMKIIDDSILTEIIRSYEYCQSSSEKFKLRILMHDLCVVYRSVMQLLTFLHLNVPKAVPSISLLASTLAHFNCLILPDQQNLTEISQKNDKLSDLLLDLLHTIADSSRALKCLVTKSSNKNSLDEVLAVISSRNENFIIQTLLVLENSDKFPVYVGECLSFFSFLISRAPEKILSIHNVSDSTESLAYKLAKKLITLYDVENMSTFNRSLETCLKSLLAFSQFSKQASMAEKLPQMLIDTLKTTIVKLTTMSITSLNSTVAKEENLAQVIFSCFVIIRNFMYGKEEAKIILYDLGFTGVVSKIWHWCTTEAPLMQAMLECMQVYAARCHKAAISMSIHSIPQNSVPVNRHASSNTLVHLLIKAAVKESNPATATRTNLTLSNTIFGLLATLSLTTECRGIMWKANFLQKFQELTVPKKIAQSSSEDHFILWVNLCVNVSFSNDGQQMIAKMNTSVDKIIEVLKISFTTSTAISSSIAPSGADKHCTRVAQNCLIILHNLCFNISNKPKLLANSTFVPSLMRVLAETRNDQILLTVAATFWAILFSNQKAKVALKSAMLLPVAQKALISTEARLSKDARNSQLFKSVCYLKSIAANLAEK